MHKLVTSFVLATFLIVACSKARISTDLSSTFSPELTVNFSTTFGAKMQDFMVGVVDDFEFTGADSTSVVMDSNSLENSSGNPPSLPITMQLKELTSKRDFVLEGVSSIANDSILGFTKSLEILALKGTDTLQLKPNARFKFGIPNTQILNGSQLALIGSSGWNTLVDSTGIDGTTNQTNFFPDALSRFLLASNLNLAKDFSITLTAAYDLSKVRCFTIGTDKNYVADFTNNVSALLPNGEQVQVLAYVLDTNGQIWYQHETIQLVSDTTLAVNLQQISQSDFLALLDTL